MILEILVCTIDEGIHRISSMLLPPADGICYLVSCQYTETQPAVPDQLSERQDVRVIFLQGRGLSRNRNWAIAHAVGDILQVADDDEQLNLSWERGVMEYYDAHPHTDVAHFMIHGKQKCYPPLFVNSPEITFRKEAVERTGLRFDERFGLGSEFLAGGEEDVFIHDARCSGLRVCFVPAPICSIYGPTTGDSFLRNVRMQRSKGAVACYTRGVIYGYYRCIRESLWWMVHRGANPIPLFLNMCRGVRYV